MKRFIFISFITVFIIFALNKKWGQVPALAKICNPFAGAWQNAAQKNKNISFETSSIKGAVEVVFDQRQVPHIYATSWEDAIYTQAYLHAQNRLWQMDMTTRLASGRLSEVIGNKTLELDRYHRRLGMVYGARASARAMIDNPATAIIIKAYTKGINDFISTLNKKNWPIEFKLLEYKPEKWTPLKTALMLKYMANTLSSKTDDISNTIAQNSLPKEIFNTLFPERLNNEYPVIKSKQIIQKSSAKPSQKTYPISVKDFYVHQKRDHSETGIGSNNWAVSPSKTQNGHAILCNDPHLPISLPSIWYECHIHVNDQSVYGASLPGAPGVIIGFNNFISWGFTNGYRDVLDYYSIKFSDSNKRHYLLNNIPTTFDIQIEEIKIAQSKSFYDTIKFTHYGPLLYDYSFPNDALPNENLAVKWMAHKATNECLAILGLNQAKNYADYVEAIKSFECPHQNIVYADTKGNIALWSQGRFIDKWPGQGRFVMDGNNIENDWGQPIPFEHNPHEKNPPQAYVMSANQINTDNSYPYYYNGLFDPSRSKRLTSLLADDDYTIEKMKKIQLDAFDQFAFDFLNIIKEQKPAIDRFKENLSVIADTNNSDLTLIHLWWNALEKELYDKGQYRLVANVNYPNKRATLQILKNNKINGSLVDLLKKSYNKALSQFSDLEKENKHFWHQYKQSSLLHMALIPAFSFGDLKMDGGLGMLNAAQGKQAPSWRMIVEMSQPIKAAVIYPGGQDGNPFSLNYKTNVEDWRIGKYATPQFEFTAKEIKKPSHTYTFLPLK